MKNALIQLLQLKKRQRYKNRINYKTAFRAGREGKMQRRQ
jgi:hypothetical protein